MLAIRLQRLGRRGYPVYRVVIQEAQRHPQSGRIVAFAGNYNPHTKEADLDEALIQKFLDDGAQPSDRVVKLLRDKTKVKLPKWVAKTRPAQKKAIKNPSKLRRNAPEDADSQPTAGSEANQEAKTDASVESVEPASAESEIKEAKEDASSESATAEK